MNGGTKRNFADGQLTNSREREGRVRKTKPNTKAFAWKAAIMTRHQNNARMKSNTGGGGRQITTHAAARADRKRALLWVQKRAKE
jgi:hypothetical protein